MKNLHIISSIQGSMGEITQDLVQSLKHKFKVTEEFGKDRPEIPESLDILLMHYVHESYIENPAFDKFKCKILIQPIDGNVLNKNYVNMINRFDLIITPSQACKRILKENKIIKDIEVVPNFYKEDIKIIKENYPIKNSDKFIYYSEAFIYKRKRIDTIYKTFIRAMSNNDYTSKVKLLLKVSGKKVDMRLIEKEISNLQSLYKNPVEVELIHEYLSYEQLKSIWNKVNAYICFSSIEGFGIPLLRLWALNKPIIAINHKDNGYIDFVNEDYLVPTTTPYKDNDNKIYDYDKNIWFDFDKDYAEYQIKKAFKQNKRYNNLAKPFEYVEVMKHYINLINKYEAMGSSRTNTNTFTIGNINITNKKTFNTGKIILK